VDEGFVLETSVAVELGDGLRRQQTITILTFGEFVFGPWLRRGLTRSRATSLQTRIGTFSKPRTVLVCRRTTFSWSTSHSGKRLSVSSMPMRPSIRASAAPMQ
jgi:hypothetical protein